MYSNDKWTSCVLLEFNMPFLSKREKVLKYQLPLCLVAILASLKLLIIMDLIFNRPKRKDPRWRYKERKISGHYTKLVLRSRTLRDTETFKDFLRMTPETFDGQQWSAHAFKHTGNRETITAPSNGPIPAQKLRVNPAPKAVFSHLMPKMHFYYFHRFI